MKKLLLFLSPLLLLAGSADAIIKCQSGSGRTSLTFLDQDLQGSFQGGEFIIDKKSIKYLPSYNSRTGEINDYANMVVNMKEGVYTLLYNDHNKLLTFYALPKSVKAISKEGLNNYYTFNAIVDWHSTDPRNLSLLNKQIWLGCTLSYGI